MCYYFQEKGGNMKNICVYCSASDGIDEIYYKDAQKLGELLGKNNYNLVYGGSDFGLMGTVSKVRKKTALIFAELCRKKFMK